MRKLTILGGGPAALILAAHLDQEQYQVTIYEKKKSVGRKFLVAGEGGLNLTYHCALAELLKQYSPTSFMEPILRKFTNQDLVNWLQQHGIPTYVGSSNRVFPDPELKPIAVLNKILDRLTANKVTIRSEQNWTGWSKTGALCYENSEDLVSDVVVFALGGASWKVTGSDGAWRDAFLARGIKVAPFRAANCAFGVAWNPAFIATHQGKPLKNIAVTHDGLTCCGELVITEFGLEGNAIYALSERIQTTLAEEKFATIRLDLKPTLTPTQLKAKYQNSRRSKVTDILKNDLNLDRAAIGLLKQYSDKITFLNPDLLCNIIKSVPIILHAADELDKAISSLGGIKLDEVDENFQLKKIPDTFVIGEMLDWYAPTGGYLLQGCFSMGFALANYLNEWPQNHKILDKPR